MSGLGRERIVGAPRAAGRVAHVGGEGRWWRRSASVADLGGSRRWCRGAAAEGRKRQRATSKGCSRWIPGVGGTEVTGTRRRRSRAHGGGGQRRCRCRRKGKRGTTEAAGDGGTAGGPKSMGGGWGRGESASVGMDFYFVLSVRFGSREGGNLEGTVRDKNVIRMEKL